MATPWKLSRRHKGSVTEEPMEPWEKNQYNIINVSKNPLHFYVRISVGKFLDHNFCFIIFQQEHRRFVKKNQYVGRVKMFFESCENEKLQSYLVWKSTK